MPTATLQSLRVHEGLGGDKVLPLPEEQGNNGWPFCREDLVERGPAILAPWGVKDFTWPGGAKQAQGGQAAGEDLWDNRRIDRILAKGDTEKRRLLSSLRIYPRESEAPTALANNIVGGQRHEISETSFQKSFSRRIYQFLLALLH